MDEQILRNLRDALNNLYDSEHLRANPLAKVFRNDTPLGMQKALENLIQALKPKPGDASRSQKRRMYDLLYSRYVDQFSQKEVADQLGISLSSYQREQRAALEFLVAVLAEKYPVAALNPSGKLAQLTSDQKNEAAGGFPNASAEEFSWMFAPAAEKISELFAVVESARMLVQPLLNRYAVDLQIKVDRHIPKVAVHPEALLHIFINLLSIAVHQATYSTIELTASVEQWETVINFKSRLSSHSPHDLSEADLASREVAKKLIDLANGSIAFSHTQALFLINVRLPMLEALPILVIDDSVDNIKLLQRYLAGTSYQMSSLSQPEQALDLIECTQPQIVILDLMMPGVDGFEILTRLHSNPTTCQIPIIVCTILPQEELALSLGASAFLQKPVMQSYLLAVLDRLASERETGSD